MKKETGKAADRPIGVFDSGLGGLTVVKELMRGLPYEDIVYFGDTARVPYGIKSRDAVIRFSKDNAALLLKRRVKMIVVACNTSSSVALPVLNKTCPVPVKGVIEPGARRACTVTRNGRIGVIATQATVRSSAYAKAILRKAPGVTVVSQACPLFVPLAEEGWTDREETLSIIRHYLRKIMRAKADTLILGCTHYPLLAGPIQKVAGPRVVLIDSAKEVALEVKALLAKARMARRKSRKAKYTFLVSDEPGHFRRLARRFLGNRINKVTRVKC